MIDSNTHINKTLEFSEYLPLALKTKAASENNYEDYLHSACGLLTEVGEIVDAYKRSWFYKKELDRVNLKEELGDVLWYVAIGLHALGKPFPEVKDVSADHDYLSDNFLLGKMIRYASNPAVYAMCYPGDWQEHPQNDFEYDLVNLLGFLNVFAARIGTTLQEAAYLNIVKLAKRYPDGFSEFNALNRDTKNELSHISSN